MTEVYIEGVKYAPSGEIPPLTDENLKKVLGVLAEMIYFNQEHKMKALAYNAIRVLAPDLAKLPEEELYRKVHE